MLGAKNLPLVAQALVAAVADNNFVAFQGQVTKVEDLDHSPQRLTMALKEAPSAFGRFISRSARPSCQVLPSNGRRAASNISAPAQEQSADFQELESQSSFLTEKPSEQTIQSYDPVKRAAARKRQLPASRYGSRISMNSAKC